MQLPSLAEFPISHSEIYSGTNLQERLPPIQKGSKVKENKRTALIAWTLTIFICLMASFIAFRVFRIPTSQQIVPISQQIVGKWLDSGEAYLEFSADGSAVMCANGIESRGTYALKDESRLEITLPNAMRDTSSGATHSVRLVYERIKIKKDHLQLPVGQGDIWELARVRQNSSDLASQPEDKGISQGSQSRAEGTDEIENSGRESWQDDWEIFVSAIRGREHDSDFVGKQVRWKGCVKRVRHPGDSSKRGSVEIEMPVKLEMSGGNGIRSPG